MREPIRKITLKDGSTRYRVVVDAGRKPDGKRAQRTATFARRRDAVAWLAETRQHVNTGAYVAPARTTLAEHLDGWLSGRRGLRPATVRNYRDALRPVRDMLGAMPLQQVARVDVERVVSAMLDGSARRIGSKGKPLSARSVNLTVTVLRAALETAVRDGQLTRNPAQYVEHVESGERRAGAAWTQEQVHRFKATARLDRLYAAWLLSLYGLRRGEVLGLRWEPDEQWSSVDLAGGVLTIGGPEATRTVVAGQVLLGPPKTKRGTRILPLDDELAAALRSLRATQAAERLAAAGAAYVDSGFVVVNELGEPLRPEAYSDTFGRLAQRAGCPPIRLHDARHTSVTIMRALGIADHVVASWHGHDETVMRATYTHTFTDELRAAAQRRAAGL